MIGRVTGVYISDDAIGADGKLDIPKIKPLARLGYTDYTCVDKVFPMKLMNKAIEVRWKFGLDGGG